MVGKYIIYKRKGIYMINVTMDDFKDWCPVIRMACLNDIYLDAYVDLYNNKVNYVVKDKSKPDHVRRYSHLDYAIIAFNKLITGRSINESNNCRNEDI